MLNILSGGSRPRYNSHNRVLAESALLAIIIYNIFVFTTSQMIALSSILIILSPALVRGYRSGKYQKRLEEKYLRPDSITILLLFMAPIAISIITTVIYFFTNDKHLFFQTYDGYSLISCLLLIIMYWSQKIKLGRKYTIHGDNFVPSSDFQYRWSEASFSYEMGIHLAENERFLFAYYHFKNAEARFKYISSIEDNETNSKDANNLSQAANFMSKYCKSTDRGDYYSAQEFLSEAKALVRIVSSNNTYKTCYNCGKTMGKSSSNKRGDKYVCDECIRFGGGNFTRTTRREREVFDKGFTNTEGERRKKGEKREKGKGRKNRERYTVSDEEKSKKSEKERSDWKEKDKWSEKKKKESRKRQRQRKDDKNSTNKQNNNKNKRNKQRSSNYKKKRDSSKKRNKNSKKDKSRRKNKETNTQSSSISQREALDILGLKRPIDNEEVKNAYREMAKKHHPDADGDTDKFIKINKAKEKLLD